MKEKLSFVIPCYYSEKTIGDVLKRIIATVNEDGRYDYEIICVNDGSTDGTQCHLDKDCFIVRNSYTADKHFVYLLYFYLITLLT